jgi:hypothetical protein
MRKEPAVYTLRYLEQAFTSRSPGYFVSEAGESHFSFAVYDRHEEIKYAEDSTPYPRGESSIGLMLFCKLVSVDHFSFRICMGMHGFIS